MSAALPRVLMGVQGEVGLLPVIVLGTGPESMAVARELAAVLIEQRELLAAEAAERRAKRNEATKRERFGVGELVFDDGRDGGS